MAMATPTDTRTSEVERLAVPLQATIDHFAAHPRGASAVNGLREALAKLRALAGERDALRAEVERLSALVYVPGLWRCAKCNFALHQRTLSAGDGTVMARDEPGEKCPNCDVPLWRVTERDASNEMIDRADEEITAREAAEARLAETTALLREARDRGLIYWEPTTTRGAVAKSDMLARIDEMLERAADPELPTEVLA